MTRDDRRMDPRAAERAFAEAVEARRKGKLALAERRLKAILAAYPDDPDTLHLAGVVRLAAGRPGDAVVPLRRALAAAESSRPDLLVPVLNALGSAFRRSGSLDAAIETFRRAAACAPGDADILFNLGATLVRTRAWAEAAKALRPSAALKPGDPEILVTLGEAARALGDLDAALAAFQGATRVDARLPPSGGAGPPIGGRDEESPRALTREESRDPILARAYAGIGSILVFRRDFPGARAAVEAALERDPDFPDSHMVLGMIRISAGDAEGALAADAEAVRLGPASPILRSNYVQHLSYSARRSAAEILVHARRWNAAHAAALATPAPFPNPRDPERRLKVGYVGGDFRNHPVGKFFAAFFPHHDKSAVETTVYMTCPRTDRVSDALRADADRWRDAALMDDAAVAEAAREDGIDVLVDIAGHTADNRLLAFARRAAPVQATGFGVTGTTGMDAIDYILADRVEIPPGYEKFYSESVVRLPHDNVCFAPPDAEIFGAHPPGEPAVAPAPARTTGFVTFGTFNATDKASPEAVALWARVLAIVPGSRFFLKNIGLGNAETRARFARRFAEAGVAEDRLVLEGPSPHPEFLAAYGRLDVALDPIPYSGGLTTFESLWMGVPVVTLPGETFASRHSASHLVNAGVPELVAKDAEDYVAIAVRLASDLDALARFRASLRARLEASPVCDGRAYARGLEAAYREMWRRWCRGEEPRSFNLPPLPPP